MASPARPSSAASTQCRIFLTGLLLALAVIAAYANSLSGPFFYDDGPAIVENRTLREGSLWDALRPPSGTTASGRPLLNLSFALNYHLGGLEVRGYHLVNLAIHVVATLVLFGLVRRTLELPGAGTKLKEHAGPVAGLAAACWGLHPVQTEAVTFVVQRAESLMGLCFLLTFYGFVRGVAGNGRRWFWMSVIACLCGMAVKEVMVTAPVLVAIYDRCFLAGTWREVWLRRGRYYLGLLAGWALLIALVATEGGNRGGSMGAGSGIEATTYWLTQVPALARYLRLSLWPAGLIFDYGYGQVLVEDWGRWALSALLVGLVLAGWLWAARRSRAVAFAGWWFLLILAPTSVIPGGQTISEHRLYLSLAAVMVMVASGLILTARRAAPWLGLACIVGLGVLTAQRNAVYRSEVALWSDSLAKFPRSAQAHNNLGTALAATGDVPAAVAEFEAALRLVPGFVDAHYNLGRGLVALGRIDEAIAHYQEALRRRPDYGAAHGNLGSALFAKGQAAEARAHFREAVRYQPQSPEALANLGMIDLASGDAAMALKSFERALVFQPDSAEAHYGAGTTLWTLGRRDEAIAHFRRALAVRPDFAPARDALNQAGVR